MRLWWRMGGCLPGHNIGIEVAEIVGYQTHDQFDVRIKLVGDEYTVYAVAMEELHVSAPGEMVIPWTMKEPVLVS